MPYLTQEAGKVLVPALATCGGVAGPLYRLALSIKEKGEGELTSLMPREVNPLSMASITKLYADLSRIAGNERVLSKHVLARFGHEEHFLAMKKEAELKLVSVADEIPAEYRAVAHTMLPIKNGVYANEGRIISFKGLVPLGAQKGNLVVHLGGVFSSCCSNRAIQNLLEVQANDPEFLKLADKVKVLDYEGTRLQRFTFAAKDELQL